MEIIQSYKLIEEYRHIASADNGEEIKLIGRIYEVLFGLNAKFIWEVNYHCQTSKETDIFNPGSSSFAQSIDDARRKLKEYIERFDDAVKWREYPLL